jgi:hypothetical protein
MLVSSRPCALTARLQQHDAVGLSIHDIAKGIRRVVKNSNARRYSARGAEWRPTEWCRKQDLDGVAVHVGVATVRWSARPRQWCSRKDTTHGGPRPVALIEVLDALKAAEVDDRVRQAAQTLYQYEQLLSDADVERYAISARLRLRPAA